MLIGRAQTPVGLSYGLIEDDLFKLIEGNPFDGIERATGEYRLSDVQLVSPVNPRHTLIMMDGYIHPYKIGQPIPEHIDARFNGDFVMPEGSRPDVDPYLFPKVVVDPGGMDDPIYMPHGYEDPLIMEPEIAVVIGKKVKGISVEDAWDAVLGFTCFNDVTLAAYLPRQPKVAHMAYGDLFTCKCADTITTIGPWIQTDITEADLDAGLLIEGAVNGETLCTGNTRNRKWTIAQDIAYASRYKTLYPGDVISLGASSMPPILSPGDTVEVTVQRIGTLRNTVRAYE